MAVKLVAIKLIWASMPLATQTVPIRPAIHEIVFWAFGNMAINNGKYQQKSIVHGVT